MSIALLLAILAALCLVVAVLEIPVPRVNVFALGMLLWLLSTLVGRGLVR